MGCDIHLYVEAKKTINEEEKWVNIDHFKLDHYEEERKYEVVHLYGDRNYNLFSILANVRNYSENKFICEPKGIPEDCSNIVKEEYEEWDCDGHSHSWFTLKELKDFECIQPKTKYSGMMTEENAKLVDSGKMPEGWCQWTNREDYVKREWEHEDKSLTYLIDKIEERKKDEFWIFGEGRSLDQDEKIRIVFWFDN